VPLTVLLLIGSPTSVFYQELSELYARDCVRAITDPDRYRFLFAHVDPQGDWRFPSSLDREAIAAAPCLDFAQAIACLMHSEIDIALPQMFCERGVGEYRALLDVLGIPYLGNRPLQMAIAADKAKAKAIVSAIGVDVPQSQLLRRGDTVQIAVPAVVKPNNADNSDGVSLVRTTAEYPAALAAAFAHSSLVLVERYVELGREVRCGVIERGSELICLPLEEYFVDPNLRPIRKRSDKLKRNVDGALLLAAKTSRESWIVAADDPVVPAVQAAALACHSAIGFRHYSLFDFRIDPSGRPWFLEAGPYCSFAPNSVLVTMMAATGVSLEHFFAAAVADVLAVPDTLSG
jgi:D-alanine-D-alanine ligase